MFWMFGCLGLRDLASFFFIPLYVFMLSFPNSFRFFFNKHNF